MEVHVVRKVLNGRERHLRRRVWTRTRARMQGGLCALCGEPMGDDVTFDHVLPKSKGGKDTLENGQATHAMCNQFKSGTIGYVRNDKPIRKKR
jgi:5-methylcytosine-specific restriction endonuclease McrA